jgi:type II secretory pathway pseudopilin PulG
VTAIWTWFLSTRIGRACVVIAAFIASIGAAWLYGDLRGAKRQKARDAAAQAQADVQAVKEAQATVADANAAAAKVRQQAEAQPPPDTAKRNDFDNTF